MPVAVNTGPHFCFRVTTNRVSFETVDRSNALFSLAFYSA